MKKITSILSITFFSSFLTVLCAQNNWERVKSNSGITIFNRPVEGTNIREFKGITVIKTTVSRLLAILRDIPAHTRWRRNCVVSYSVKKFDSSNMIIYNVTKAPWPLNYRDSIVKITMESAQENKKIIFTMNAIKDNLVPRNNKYIRITELTGQFILEKISADATRVIYTIKANPAGMIPSAIANYASKNLPYYTLRGLRRMAQRK